MLGHGAKNDIIEEENEEGTPIDSNHHDNNKVNQGDCQYRLEMFS